MSDDGVQEGLEAFFADCDEPLACAYLFGSVARGTARAGSDVDVAVLYRHDPPATLAHSGVRLAARLEERLGRRVDVVVLNRAPLDLVHRVLRDGVMVLERDRAARVRFEVASRSRYLDLRPVLDRYRRVGSAARG